MRQATLFCGFLSMIFASSLSCADQHNTRQSLLVKNSVGTAGAEMQLLAQDTINVVDENNNPVANATVLLGYDVGNPFAGNLLTADAQGVATVPADWKAALPMTVQAKGYVTSTLPMASPGTTTVQLTALDNPQQLEIKGTTTDFGHLIDDGNVHFALVVPGIDPTQMLNFNMSTVLSPQADSISVIGKSFNIPSNITLPDQSVSYIFPIQFNKPDYRSYVRKPGSYTMSATHGSFPLQKVVSQVRSGKSMFDVINDFTFIEGGQKTVTVAANVAGADLSVNQIPFKSTVSVKAPTVPASQVMVSLALMAQNGLLMPTDLKRLASGQSMDLVSTGSTPSVLSLLMVDANATVLAMMEKMISFLDPAGVMSGELAAQPLATTRKPQSFQQLSYALQPATGAITPVFLPLINPPTLDTTTNVVKMDLPVAPTGLSPLGTYLVLSEIQSSTTSGVVNEQSTHLWEVWSDTWLAQVELPKIKIARNASSKYRWEVMYLARPSAFTGATNATFQTNLKTVTHVTRNSLDI